MTTAPHPRPRSVVRAAAMLLAAVALLAMIVAPVAAKEFLQARLEAPISFESPPGVGAARRGHRHGAGRRSAAPGRRVADLAAADRAERRRDRGARGAMGTGPGRYEMRITVPPGAASPTRGRACAARATCRSCSRRDPFTFRPIGAGTAQLAPPVVALDAVRRGQALPAARAPVSARGVGRRRRPTSHAMARAVRCDHGPRRARGRARRGGTPARRPRGRAGGSPVAGSVGRRADDHHRVLIGRLGAGPARRCAR